MQSTLVKHNKFFKAGHATSFDTAKKYAVRCDAASSEYGRIPEPGLITTGDFSLVMSFRYNNGIGGTGPFFLTHGCTARIHPSAGTLRITIFDGTRVSRFDTDNNVGDGEWHTIVLSIDRDGDANYYENYDSLGSGYTESFDISIVEGDLEDGGSVDDWLFGFDGAARYAGIDFDQIAIYDAALSTVQAITNYLRIQSGLELGQPGVPIPICYWKCNEGTGTSVANDGSESNAMTLYNTPTWITDGMI